MDYSGYYNVVLRKVAPSGRSFDGVGGEGTLRAGHVAGLFSANQSRDSEVEGKLYYGSQG